MGSTQSLLQPDGVYFTRCIAVIATIILIASLAAAQATSTGQPPLPLPPDLTKYPGLLPEFGQLMEKLQHDIQVPPARAQSRLLPLLPESTTFYAAFPNYGEAFHQALTIFQQELQQNSILRDWWQHGEMAANGPKVEDSLEKFYQFSQYLGDEIVVSAATEGRKDPSLLVLAEVRKPALKEFIQQRMKELTGKSEPEVRLLDTKELATAIELRPAQKLTILVRPDFVVAALDVATLRNFNARLDRSSRDFAATPFGQRVAQAYEGGAMVVAAADLQKIISQMPPGTDPNQKTFQRTGFADMKYLVWEHKNIAGLAASQAELSFTGPRHGAASWLAAPRPLASLDFVSPEAILVGAVLLKNPAEIFDDVKDLATASNPTALAALEPMEQGLKLSLRDDLINQLGGEIAYEVDSLKPPNPIWKVMLRVNSPDRLQTTLDKLLATMHISAQPSEDGGITYHTLRLPTAKTATEISYAFVDGYLVIASSRDAVAEAIRIHRSGESLAKSQKFLASLPPGRQAEASALLYEVPSAIAEVGMRQLAPQMADYLSQAAAQAGPVVMCAYGEESALREASRSGGIDAGAILIGAAIAIPNLLRARIAANESSAVANIRTANTAQAMYHSAYSERGFARDLATLGPDPSGSNSASADHASVLDVTLGNASCTGNAWCTKSGFRFMITTSCKKPRCDEYVVVGTPIDFNSGTRSFCSTSDAVVRYKSGPLLPSPVTSSECQAWSPLQ